MRYFALNRRVMKAYLLKESLDRLWSYTYEGAMLRLFPNRFQPVGRHCGKANN